MSILAVHRQNVKRCYGQAVYAKDSAMLREQRITFFSICRGAPLQIEKILHHRLMSGSQDASLAQFSPIQ